ncbi:MULTISPECIES: hypothetical protein [unclassified Mannheimia]|uniref:hypothetical protein n=1 Tax=unclassified Mannheimia TaxID=2645054 RepID=UPI00359D1799
MKKSIPLILSFFSASLFAEVQLSPLALTEIGKVSQFDLSEQGELIFINRQNELWKMVNQAQKLADGVSTEIEPKAQHQRIALADKNGYFMLWTADKIYTSDIPLAPKATMVSLNFATIAVTKQHGQFMLARIETQGNQVTITASAETEVLPDTHPLQIDFDSETPNQGHIAVLAKPDDATYQHGVLGDDIEAGEIQFLERHTLKPLAEKLTQKGRVFEANRFATLTENGKTKLISVIAGDGNGASTAVISLKEGKLLIEIESESLPTNRWQSPFSFNNKLYAIQMPHLKGNLVEYSLKGNRLTERFITSGLSNHRYGDYETNLAAATDHFAIIPKAGYQQLIVLGKTGNITELPMVLPAEIKQTKAYANKVYLLLKNGQIWIAEEKQNNL